MAGSGVTVETLKADLLYGLLSRLPLLSAWPGLDGALDRAIKQAESFVAQELGTRWDVTQFRSYMGAADPGAPVSGEEFEAPYDWPGYTPGDGYPRIRTRVRPLVAVTGLNLNLPGSIVAPYSIPLSWCRVDRSTHEIMIAPSAGTVPFGLAQARWWTGLRIPEAALLEYTAGLGEAGLATYPQLARLASLHAALFFLPSAAIILNPSTLSSESADGLSQSRSNGYVFKDLEDRLRTEADALMLSFRHLWDGPGLTVL